jgi:hypothetical protein
MEMKTVVQPGDGSPQRSRTRDCFQAYSALKTSCDRRKHIRLRTNFPPLAIKYESFASKVGFLFKNSDSRQTSSAFRLAKVFH